MIGLLALSRYINKKVEEVSHRLRQYSERVADEASQVRYLPDDRRTEQEFVLTARTVPQKTVLGSIMSMNPKSRYTPDYY